jgi:CDP-2,3-bis-(O-geranylgeranyl)-sn-glycerol synthase
MIDIAGFLLLICPPYVANGSAVLASKLKWRHPVDFGKMLPDGRRVFGDGKTYEGLLIGISAGTLVGYLPNIACPRLALHDALILSAAAMLGDLLGAFIKRRLCMPRGYPAVPLDQLDFILASLLVYSIYADVPLEFIAAAAVITPLMHRATNRIAHLVGLKGEPW